VIGRFESGFTEGTIGFGVDAFAMLGLKLDTGDGRSGAGGSVDVMPYNSLGQAEDNYSKLGGAVKTRFMDTEIKVGDVFPVRAGMPTTARPTKSICAVMTTAIR